MAIAVVTGTSAGIGLATAVTLGRAGHTVVATMRNLNGGAELQKVISDEKLPVTLSRLDIDDDASVKDAFEQALAKHGRIDVLVNNAGIGVLGSVEETPMAAFRETMETNFFGALRCIKAVIPGMRERRHGCIVNVTSIAGRVAMTPYGPYAASKWAFEALSECLAQEMKAFNVRVAIVEPGIIATAMVRKIATAKGDSRYPHLSRVAARFRAALASPVSPYVVGEQIREIVNGDSWRLRYPVGRDAVPSLQWRAGISDEDLVAIQAETDAEFVARMKAIYGFEVTL